METYNSKRMLSNVLSVLVIVGCIGIGIICFRDRRYSAISIVIAFIACIPFFVAYEKKRGNIRRMVILAVLVSISVIGRILVFVPGFKPVTAVVTITGMYMGPEAGFLCGALSAVLSNLFFGQGPWTPFQMLSWGIIGLIAGSSIVRKLLHYPIGALIYGIISGVLYSLIMDIWTVLALDGQFCMTRYLVAITAAIPITMEYAVSNVIFLWVLARPLGEKLERIKKKHGIFI